MEQLKPARVIPPGRIILRELEARGWTQEDLARIMGRPMQMVSEMIRGKKQITAETARQLAKSFGTSPDLWLGLEMKYQLQRAEKEQGEQDIAIRSRLYEMAPVNELIKRGWINAVETTSELEDELYRFLGIANLDALPEICASYRLSQERGPQERAKIAWIKRVEHLVAKQSVGEYHPEQLDEMIQQILSLTLHEEEIRKVPNLLLEHGIHFVIVPHLPKSFIDGASMWLAEHPVIALSLRHDRIDAFWFTLFHELAHIKDIQNNLLIEQLFGKKVENNSDEENQINQTTTNWLIAEYTLNEFIEWNSPRYSRENILSFAAAVKRHPGIVVGQLMHRDELKYSHLREYLIKVSPYLADWQDVSSPN